MQEIDAAFFESKTTALNKIIDNCFMPLKKQNTAKHVVFCRKFWAALKSIQNWLVEKCQP
jgi:elongation factor P hydroxylase